MFYIRNLHSQTRRSREWNASLPRLGTGGDGEMWVKVHKISVTQDEKVLEI